MIRHRYKGFKKVWCGTQTAGLPKGAIVSLWKQVDCVKCFDVAGIALPPRLTKPAKGLLHLLDREAFATGCGIPIAKLIGQDFATVEHRNVTCELCKKKSQTAMYHYPHKCPVCKGPAYIGFTVLDCQKGCNLSQKEKKDHE